MLYRVIMAKNISRYSDLAIRCLYELRKYTTSTSLKTPKGQQLLAKIQEVKFELATIKYYWRVYCFARLPLYSWKLIRIIYQLDNIG